MPEEKERKVGPVYRVLSQDLYSTDLHSDEFGVRQQEVWRSKSRQYTKDAEIIGKIVERRFDEKIDSVKEETDLIVLPEMFTTGFTMNAAGCAEGMDGSAATWLRGKSRTRSVDIVGSVIIEEDGR